jgi:hypothetical protein
MHLSKINAPQAFDMTGTHLWITGAAGGIGSLTKLYDLLKQYGLG